jgi:hypothetical protein
MQPRRPPELPRAYIGGMGKLDAQAASYSLTGETILRKSCS